MAASAVRMLSLPLDVVGRKLLARPEIGSAELETARRAAQLVELILGDESCTGSAGANAQGEGSLNAEYLASLPDEVFDAAWRIADGAHENYALRAAAEQVAPEMFDAMMSEFSRLRASADPAASKAGEFI